jgi:catechol 2,3-dioxygenase-like lactoylglutathione lyase family enzyme
MIGYVAVGTNDLARAGAFYDGLLVGVGEKRIIDTDALIGWGKDGVQPMFIVMRPSDGEPAQPGHGPVVAMVQSSTAQVDKQHARALKLGGVEESAPAFRGQEGDQGFYAGYCRDPDGNRLCLYFLGARS